MTGGGADTAHEQWLVQIDAELDGELSLVERAALAKHLATCARCAGARASQLEVRVALATGLIAGWAANRRWGGPGAGSTLEESRGIIVVQ